MQVVCTNIYLYRSNFCEVIIKSFRGPVFLKHSVCIYWVSDVELMDSGVCVCMCSTDGRVCAMAAVGSSQIICTTELPLDQLCRTDKMDLFQLPGLYVSVCLSVCLHCVSKKRH